MVKRCSKCNSILVVNLNVNSNSKKSYYICKECGEKGVSVIQTTKYLEFSYQGKYFRVSQDLGSYLPSYAIEKKYQDILGNICWQLTEADDDDIFANYLIFHFLEGDLGEVKTYTVKEGI